MRSTLVRLAALCAGVAVAVSCDAGPTVTRFGNGISGGPTGTSPVVPAAPGSPDSNPPLARWTTPPTTTTTLVNVGDSIFVAVRLNDDRALGSLTITGYKEVGDPNLGTFQRIARYPTITVPSTGTFRSALVDTTITRYLKPATPLDTTIGPLILEATVTDSAGNTYTAKQTVQVVTGPKVFIIAPTTNDSVPRGVPMSISVNALHNDGVDSLTVRVLGENTAAWATKLDTTVRIKFPTGTKNDTLSFTVTPPADAPLRGRVTISANAVDINRNPGSATPVVVFLRAVGTLPPRVYQTVPLKLEISDNITVTATGDGIVSIGRVLLDSVNNVVSRDSVVYTAPFTSNRTETLPLNLGLSDQGRRLNVISFAWDANTPPNIGYSLKAGVSTPDTVMALAARDTTLITYGRTFTPPRNGVIGDVAVHPNGSVFLSNTAYNLLEVWNNGSKAFVPTGVQVGAQPWGMFLSLNPDTLFVANSGATTISRVCVNACASGTAEEDLTTGVAGKGRIRTRNNVVFQVLFSRDDATGKIRLTKRAEVSYSDRPQYIAQSAGGRLFYSTRPTESQPAGTIRWLDPTLPVPDPRQVWSYGTVTEGDNVLYTIFNADSVKIHAVPPSSPLSDTLFLYDHPYGSATTVDFVAIDSIPVDAASKARALGSDVELVLGLNLASLDLTDTTFVASSSDKNWIAFGEGNTAGGTGRIMMINDPAGGVVPGYFSPGQTVTDIVNNASEKVFGVAVDSTGLQVTAHGTKTYMASVDLPFHLRLDGEYDSFDDGAGVAYHPQAKSVGSLAANRVAFSATRSGVIEVIDVAHYNNRGKFITKGNLYGALRATGPLPGDPPEVILKLFGLTANGLIVIDVRASDIKP